MKLAIQIDRVVLDGFPLTALDRDVFAHALEGELTRLFLEAGPTAVAAASAATISAPPIMAAQPLDAFSLGAEVARSVFQGIGRAGV